MRLLRPFPTMDLWCDLDALEGRPVRSPNGGQMVTGVRPLAVVLVVALAVLVLLAWGRGGGGGEGSARGVASWNPVSFVATVDSDGDGVADGRDNCPALGNPEQADADGDGAGDRYGATGEALCDGADNRYGLSPENTALQNREALVAAMSGTYVDVTDVATGEVTPECSSVNTNEVSLPPGDYLIENSAPPDEILIRCFGGSFTMRKSPEGAARLVFTNSEAEGIRWELAQGARFVGMTTKFENPEGRIDSYELLTVAHSSGVLFEDLVVDGSAAAGLYVADSLRPKVLGARIANTKADGLHFANSTDAYVENLETRNTGDDGLAFFRNNPDSGGGVAKDVRVYNSGSRGIAVIGQRDVEVSDFRVENTDGNGLHVAEEPSYGSALPENVYFHDGEVYGAGCRAGLSTHGDSVFYNGVGPNVRFTNVRSYGPLTGPVGTNGYDVLAGEPAEIDVSSPGADSSSSCSHRRDDPDTAESGWTVMDLLEGVTRAVRELHQAVNTLLPPSGS